MPLLIRENALSGYYLGEYLGIFFKAKTNFVMEGALGYYCWHFDAAEFRVKIFSV